MATVSVLRPSALRIGQHLPAAQLSTVELSGLPLRHRGAPPKPVSSRCVSGCHTEAGELFAGHRIVPPTLTNSVARPARAAASKVVADILLARNGTRMRRVAVGGIHGSSR